MEQQDQDAVVERFRPTSGRVSGFVGLATAAVVLVLALASGDSGTPVGVAIVAVLGGVLVWAALLRPALWATRRDLVLRGIFHTDRVPLVAIDRVRATQVLTITAGDRTLVTPVVGYSLRQTVKTKGRTGGLEQPDLGGLDVTPGPTAGTTASSQVHQAFVEARIEHLARDARDVSGIRQGSPEQRAAADDVRRTWAWPEIGAVTALAVLFVLWLVV